MNDRHLKRSLSGIQPSGNVHLGNYLGMIKPALKLQEEYQCLYFIADLHALTSNRDAARIHSFTMDLAALWLALGLDVEEHLFYRQSDVPFVTEYAWYLSCFTGLGFLEKGHSFKDARANNRDVNHGILAYPVLMAADILMYEVDIVPVGKDQRQHVEMARDMAGFVNAALGEDIIKLPQAVIKEEVMTIPGLDGRKMSKSYNNEIPLFCDEKTLRKKIMSLKTDSTPLEKPKTLTDTPLGTLYALFATPAQYHELDTSLKKGGTGWGHAKEVLFDAVNSEIKHYRAEYLKLRSDENLLCNTLKAGAEKAYQIAHPVLNKLRKALGFNKLSGNF